MKKIALLAISLVALAGGVSATGPIDYANPLQGTNSNPDFSTGNGYPAVAVPWGMNFWTPQTGAQGDGWQYTYTAGAIRGFKQTHQPSPWVNDYGCFSIMPVCGEIFTDEGQRASPFSHWQETSRPNYYSVMLSRYGIQAEMTPSNRGVIMRFTYPQSDAASVLVDCFKGDGYVKVIPAENKIVGYSRFYAPNCNIKLPDNFATYFVITSSKPFELSGSWKGGKRSDATEQTGKAVGAFVTFKTTKGEQVELKIASSFISLDQAQTNYDREIKQHNFESLERESAGIWNRELSRTMIKGATDEQTRTFYSALYRLMLFPRTFYEIDPQGNNVHWSPFKGTVEKGKMYTDNGFWDTFRAAHPYFTIMYPDLTAGLMEGLVAYYREGGWIPEWLSAGYRDCMVGQNSASVIANAYLTGIKFDAETLWEGTIKGANNEGPNATGRSGCEYYNRLGYVPYNVDVKESVSRTLEYAYDDWCIYRMGEAMGKPKDVTDLYKKRALNYANVFDASTGFVRPRDDKGAWDPHARPDIWGGSFTEGSAWHWTWSVFQDPKGLINLMGGEKNFIARLDSIFVAKPSFEWSNYKRVIHEMTEMVAGNMGQYAHGNEPVHHVLYLYAYAGEPWKTQYWVRQTMDRLYHSGLNDGQGLCGDEDTGQMSAWYVFSAMGFYPVCPGSLQYVLGSPLFEQTTISLPNGKKFTVKAPGNSAKNVYVQSAKLNGKPLDRSYITHNEIVSGGVLELTMGPQPNKAWAAGEGARPASMSK